MAKENPIFRTIGYGTIKISLIGKSPTERIFASFKDTVLLNPTPDIIKALQKKNEEYDARRIPMKERGFVTQEVFDALVTPDKTYITYKGKMLHVKDVLAGLEVAEKNGWTPEYKDYIFLNKPQTSQTRVA